MKSKIKARPLAIKGTLEITHTIFEDARGFIYESYNKRDLISVGINDDFVQENHLGTKKGALRGLHFLRNPHASGKLVKCVTGESLYVFVDLRKNSPSLGKWDSVLLSPEHKNALYIPKGFAHGVYGISEWSEIVYLLSDFHYPEIEGGVRWNDPDIHILWPSQHPIVSEKDSKQPFLSDIIRTDSFPTVFEQ